MNVRLIAKRIINFLYPPTTLTLDNYRGYDMIEGDEYFGRMNDPTSAGSVSGSCGDSMEFYLEIKDENIIDIKYYTEGCENTRSSGFAVAKRAKGKMILDALSINPAEIIRAGDCDPDDGRHCAILAVSTLYQAIADYLLQP